MIRPQDWPNFKSAMAGSAFIPAYNPYNPSRVLRQLVLESPDYTRVSGYAEFAEVRIVPADE